ncbi:MAG TPA: magnesium transporter [Dehalococcoidia bacterium]|jgi:magnesium transporter|nr:magnesium transporter [Dehalococcoidia bacterium]
MANQEQMEALRDQLRQLVEDGALDRAVALLAEEHPADQADLIYELADGDASRVIRVLPIDQLAEVIEFLNEDLRAEVLPELPAEVLAPVLDQLDEDVAADIVQELEPEHAEEVIRLLEDRESVEELLRYPEESAGGRMSTEVVALRRQWTVEEAIQFLRRETPDDTHPFYLYVVDEDGKLTGTVSLRSLVTAAPETPIAAIMSEEVRSVGVTEDQEVAAERMRHYNLLALPVVDESQRLLGVITADDVLDVQVEEATEDIYRMAGLAEEERIFRPIREAVPTRLAWLTLNLVTAFMAAATVSLFEGTIEQVAALAVFMPMVAGMGGNAGIQTITLVVRSIALGEIEPRDAAEVLRHELVIAAIKGVFIGVLVGIIAWAWMGNSWFGLVVAVAMLANIANATLVGVLVPMLLKRLRADPALASGVIVTTFSDVVGFFVFLGLGALLVDKLS